MWHRRHRCHGREHRKGHRRDTGPFRIGHRMGVQVELHVARSNRNSKTAFINFDGKKPARKGGLVYQSILPSYSMHTVLEQNCIYRPQTKFAKVMFLYVSVILSTGGEVVSQHALQLVSQHALQVSWGGSPGLHPGGEVEGSGQGGVSRPTPTGCLQAHTRGGCVSQHALKQTPP